MFSRRLALPLPLLSCLTLLAADLPRSQPPIDEQRLKLIPVRLQELVDRQNIPGAVALVARHDKILLHEAVGYSDYLAKKPMQKDSIFQIMSMTKPFTGVAIMMLVEEGKLELRQPVDRYLPEFKGTMMEERDASGNVHLRKPEHGPSVWQLMCHTSGLGGDPEGDIADNPRTLRLSLADAVRHYGEHQHLKFEPGTRWRYSNMGIATLGRIIEAVSGQDYVQFIQTRIIQPLGMKDTMFLAAPADKQSRIALVHKHRDGKLIHSGAETLAGDSTKFRAGAVYPAPEFGLYSTASDLLKFYQMLIDNGVYQGKRYLSKAAISVMTEVHTPDVTPSGWLGGTGYGLTFEIVNKPQGRLLLHSMGTFGHGGAFGTEGWIDPQNDLIRILLVQVSDGTADAARAAVMQIAESAVLP